MSRCTRCWSRRGPWSTPTPSRRRTPPSVPSPSARPTCGRTWGYGTTRASTGRAAASWSPPAQSAFTDVRDLEALAASCARGRALGFLGRTAIHPRQLPVIERAYRPTPQELEAAEEIVEAAAGEAGALALPDGRFVDAAIVAAARRTLALGRV